MFETSSPNDHSPEATAAHGLAVFGNEDDLSRWRHSENQALSGIRSATLLATEAGRRQMSDILGRIQHGIYS